MAIFQKLSGGPIAVNELARMLPVAVPPFRSTSGAERCGSGDGHQDRNAQAVSARPRRRGPSARALRPDVDPGAQRISRNCRKRHRRRSSWQTQAEALDLKVFKSIRVNAPVERAFSVFVEQMETWWPATHHIGKTPFEAIFIEPRVGGRWYERNVEGANATGARSSSGIRPTACLPFLACRPGP